MMEDGTQTSLDVRSGPAPDSQHPVSLQAAAEVVAATAVVAFSAEEIQTPRFVHPASVRLCRQVGEWVRRVPVFGPALECYGPRLLLTLSAFFFLFKGISYQTLLHSLFPMFHDRFGATTLEYQRFRTVSTMGWSIKPFTALLSDAFALFGYKKRWILSFSAAFGALCSIVFALLPPQRSAAAAAACLAFLIGFAQANLDILLEGLYARKIAAQSWGGPALVSAVWVSQLSAGIVAALIQGPLSDAGLAYVGNIIGGVCLALCLPLALLNWLEEDKNRVERLQDLRNRRAHEQALGNGGVEEEHEEVVAIGVTAKGAAGVVDDGVALHTSSGLLESRDGGAAVVDQGQKEGNQPEHMLEVPLAMESDHEPQVQVPSDHNEGNDVQQQQQQEEEEEEFYIPTYCGGAIEFNKEVLVRNWRITISSILMTLIVVVMAIVTTFYGGAPLLAVVLVGTVLLTLLMFWSLPLVVAKAGLFACLYQGFYVIITSPLDAFYLAPETCLVDGPHFSYFFYNTISGVIGNLAGVMGVVGFTYIFSQHSYRLTFIITVAAEILASIFDLVIVKRWNIRIGIPDRYMYLFGDAVVYQVAYMLSWMPLFLLLVQLCPHGSESMVFALLVSFFNHGRIISGTIGALLMEWVWPVVSEGTECDFSHLWKLIVVGHMVMPLLIIFSAFYLIPAARICDELDEQGQARTPAPPRTQHDPRSAVTEKDGTRQV